MSPRIHCTLLSTCSTRRTKTKQNYLSTSASSDTHWGLFRCWILSQIMVIPGGPLPLQPKEWRFRPVERSLPCSGPTAKLTLPAIAHCFLNFILVFYQIRKSDKNLIINAISSCLKKRTPCQTSWEYGSNAYKITVFYGRLLIKYMRLELAFVQSRVFT